ncbi:OmpA family protein [Celeribacter arenosi]|uniref:OmpA family protein n=1 Tax=Celeribacter arenosi TaxID=792649 RepID=A0ABP7K1T9_9RHOB
MRLSPNLTILAALVAGALASLIAANVGAQAIEATSETAVRQKLGLEGFEWVDVQADGLQVILTGTAPSENQQLAAQRAAGHVVDPSRVINVMDVVQTDAIPAPEFSIEILRNDSGISLIGLVPQSWDRDGFVDALRKAATTGSIADFLEQADYPAPEGWEDATDFGIEAIGLLPRSKISLSARNVAITGLADGDAQKVRLERALAAAAPKGVVHTIHIAAPRPVITPFTVRLLIDETGPRFDACTAETPQGHARIIAAARALGMTDPECTIGLGAPANNWAGAVETGMRALAKLGSGSITYSDGNVNLLGTAGTDQSTFDEIAGELEAALPSTFTLHATLPAPETAESDQQPQFIAIRSPEGQVQLRGRISDERSKMATEAVARAEFGSQSIYSAIRTDDSLPEGWAVRALVAVNALAELSHGSVTMRADGIEVRGETGNSNARAEIARMLAESLGDGQEYEINVNYVRKLDPVLNLPTPLECVERANRIITANKIVFDPGQATLNDVALDTLDRIAAALKECEDVEIEIGAHSDSQGREEMNLNLSQARANSVLDGLLARRVVGVDFSAKGYGETTPIADNGTEEGREANRRIEFKLLGGSGHDDHDHTEDADLNEVSQEDGQSNE